MMRGAATHHLFRKYFLGIVAQASRDGEQFSSLHQHLELRDKNSIDASVIDDTHQTVAEMSGERRVYVENRQADNVRARRFSSKRTHTEIPRSLAGADKNTVATEWRLFCETQPLESFVAHQRSGVLT